jgi:hypothetical protein
MMWACSYFIVRIFVTVALIALFGAQKGSIAADLAGYLMVVYGHVGALKGVTFGMHRFILCAILCHLLPRRS